jgi:hypothetical protein
METQLYFISDAEIISMIDQNDNLGWVYLRDKYALMMYIAALTFLHSEYAARKILNKLFTQLKTNAHILKSRSSLPECLLYHTYAVSMSANTISRKRKYQIPESLYAA